MKIDTVNWPEFPHKPRVEFRIIKMENSLNIKFFVEETGCKARIMEANGPVYRDSCVEFFVDPIGDGFYYNFEFNCIGNMLLGYGKSRENRILAPLEIIKKIIRKPSLKNIPFETRGNINWELDIKIPFPAFFQHKIISVSRINCNFYKCGDETPTRHYLTWMPVKTVRPDFHRPEYFGELNL